MSVCTKSPETSKHNVTCKSSNLIYCITCKTCKKQYVGQTSNTITKRFYSHFHNIKHSKATDGVSLHFSRPDHRGQSDIKIHVLDFIKLPPKTDRAKALRLEIERMWIHRLRCPEPRGLNILTKNCQPLSSPALQQRGPIPFLVLLKP